MYAFYILLFLYIYVDLQDGRHFSPNLQLSRTLGRVESSPAVLPLSPLSPTVLHYGDSRQWRCRAENDLTLVGSPFSSIDQNQNSLESSMLSPVSSVSMLWSLAPSSQPNFFAFNRFCFQSISRLLLWLVCFGFLATTNLLISQTVTLSCFNLFVSEKSESYSLVNCLLSRKVDRTCFSTNLSND